MRRFKRKLCAFEYGCKPSEPHLRLRVIAALVGFTFPTFSTSCHRGDPPASPTPRPFAPSVAEPSASTQPQLQCSDAVQQLDRAKLDADKGRVLAALRRLDQVPSACVSSDISRLEAELQLVVGNIAAAKDALARLPDSQGQLHHLLTKTESLILQRKRQEESKNYLPLVEDLRRLRMGGDCSTAYHRAAKIIAKRYPAGQALWEQSKAAGCLGKIREANVLASQSFIEIDLEEHVKWDAASALPEASPPPNYSGYAMFASDNVVRLEFEGTAREWTFGSPHKPAELTSLRESSRDIHGISNDGRFVIAYDDKYRVTVSDALTHAAIWTDPKPFGTQEERSGDVGIQVMEPAPGNGDEAVIATQHGRFYRWDLRSGKRLPTVTTPKNWIQWAFKVRTDGGGDLIAVTVAREEGGLSERLMRFPEGRAYDPRISAARTPWRNDAWPGTYYPRTVPLDDDHLEVNDGDRIHLWSLRESRELPLMTPASFSRDRLSLEAKLISGSGRKLFMLWKGIPIASQNGTAGERPRHQITAVLTERGGDGQWTGPSRVFEPTHIVELDRLQLASNERALAAWGRGGLVVWSVDSGQPLIASEAKTRTITDACVDPVGSHIALHVPDSTILVDLRNGTSRLLESGAVDNVGCDETGLTGIRTKTVDTRSVFKWSWVGRLEETSVAVANADAPNLSRSKAKARMVPSALGHVVKNSLEVCLGRDCKPVVGSLREDYKYGLRDAAYALDGRVLVVITKHGARLLSPDGQRLFGIIGHDGNAGWFFSGPVSTTDVREMSRDSLVQCGLRGRTRLELLQGAATLQGMRCSAGDRVYEWNLCADWYLKPGAFQEALAALR